MAPAVRNSQLTPPTPGGVRRVADLRFRIALAASIGLVLLVLVFFVTLSSALQVRRSILELSDLHLAAESFRSVNNGMLSMESSQRGFLLTGDSVFLGLYDTALAGLERRIDSLHRVRPMLPADTARFNALDSLVRERLLQINATVAVFAAQGRDAAVDKMLRNEATGSTDSIRATLRALNDAEERERLAVRAASASAGRNLILAEVVGGIFALLLLVIALRQIFADLQAREQAEASLRRSERFLDSIIDLLPLMVFVKEARELRFVSFNRTAEQLVGLPREAVLGRDDFDLFPRPIAQGYTTIDRAVLASDAVRDVPEEVMIAPNGAVRTMHTRKVAIHDDAGQPAFLLGVSEDITERKRAEVDVERAREAAEAASRAKSDFLAKMSHELRTPLNSIIGFSQLMEEESFGPLNDRQRRYINNVLTSGRQLLDLINDILDLSKVEAGRMELSLTHAPVMPLLREALSLVEPLAVKAGLHLTLDADNGLPAILVDVSRFRQVMYNLLGNAIKFTGPGGTVTLRAGVSPNRPRAGTQMIRISVNDTGVGIRPDDLERIFREFEQVDNDAGLGHKGTGLGLALARRLAELHGGRLWAESDFGVGSSFHVELPVSPDISPPIEVDPAAVSTEASHSRAVQRAVPSPQRPLVLVVEDDPGYAELLQQYLEDSGYRVAQVKNGDEVMESVAELHPDAITMDIVIPGRDGLGVLHQLKSDPRTARIPVLVVSVVEDRVRGVALGAFDWLVKPVQREALVATMQRALANAVEAYPLVLAIDDDPGALDVITAILEGVGFRVATATDPRHGLQLAESLSPAAIVLDLAMPHLSGFEVVTALREIPHLRDVPIVVFSGRELSHDDRSRLEQHVLRILAKPGTADLVAELQRLGLPATP
jgi:PAS domain S-box-containing protein